MFSDEELIVLKNLVQIGLNGLRVERSKFSYLGDEVLAQYDENIKLTVQVLNKLSGLVAPQL